MILSRARPWILAARPKTLIATIAPISIGATIALSDGVFIFSNFVVALLSALCIQIGTNLANDYFDFIKGADTQERVGPIRVTQSGLIAPHVVRLGFILCFALAAILGLYLVYEAGVVIMWVGIASIASGIAYTAGPWPLAYVGLGEVFVLVFFGPVASGFCYFVVTQQWSAVAFVLGLCAGVLSCAILVANNLRDIAQDTLSHKRTLAVRLGKKAAKIEYALTWVCAFLVVIAMSFIREDFKMLLPLLTLPLAISLSLKVFSYQNAGELIEVLEGTAKGLAIFTMLLCAGILL